MTDEEIKNYIDIAVQKTIKEYKKNGILKDNGAAAYADISEILSSYYKGGKSEMSITYAIQGQRFDPYYRIIQMYFEAGKTIAEIAEELNVDTSTIVKNKKRLCLAIYNEII